jgi:hypothetical protein
VILCYVHIVVTVLSLWLCAVFTGCDCPPFTCYDCIHIPHLWDCVDQSSCTAHSPKSSLKILQLMWSLFSYQFMIFDGSGHHLTSFCIGFYISSKCFLPTSWNILKLPMTSPQFFTAFEVCESELNCCEHFQEFYIFLKLFY